MAPIAQTMQILVRTRNPEAVKQDVVNEVVNESRYILGNRFVLRARM